MDLARQPMGGRGFDRPLAMAVMVANLRRML